MSAPWKMYIVYVYLTLAIVRHIDTTPSKGEDVDELRTPLGEEGGSAFLPATGEQIDHFCHSY